MNDLAIRTELPVQVAELPMRLTASAIRAQVNLIQEVMQAVMHKDVHYGVIPGCKQPSLYKAGSEVLLTTFRIAVVPEVEDLSTADERRYRVRAKGVHIQTGEIIGVGVGECSSMEEKYKWRKASKAEYDAAPEDRRRMKHYEKYSQPQVRTEVADVSNTVLKMAKKRAQIDMTLTALAASDCFTQDIEDLPEEYLDAERSQAPRPSQPQTLPAYTEEQFAKNLPTWREMIANGEKSVEHVITMLSKRVTLTEEQKNRIKALATPAASEGEAQ